MTKILFLKSRILLRISKKLIDEILDLTGFEPWAENCET